MASSKQFRYILLVLILAAIAYRIASSPGEGFSEGKINSTLDRHPEWSIPVSGQDPKVQKILTGRFKFLGEGAQAFAFESEDQKYVLKFFKMRRFTPSLEDYLCPHVVRRRLNNLRWVFNGYKIAYDKFRSDTGLVFIHLAKTDHLQQKVLLIDQKGKEHTIDLDKTEFVLQEKAELLFDRLKTLRQQGNTKEVQKAIASILELVQRRIDQGYADRDKAVSNNFGFVGDRPVQLDVGRLYRGTRPKQLEHVRRRITGWEKEDS